VSSRRCSFFFVLYLLAKDGGPQVLAHVFHHVQRVTQAGAAGRVPLSKLVADAEAWASLMTGGRQEGE
jgi:hypothetical protein